MTIDYQVKMTEDNATSVTNTLLEQYDAYIIALAWKNVPRNLVHSMMLLDEVDELAQKIRIKLWQKSQQEPIISPKAYISRIAYTEAIDMVRRLKSILSLTTDLDGEIDHGNLLVIPSAGMQDPAEEIDQQESLINCITKLAEAILVLPPRQQQSIIWVLKSESDDFLPLIVALRDHGIDIDTFNWSDDNEEEQRLRASLSIARKKLSPLKDLNIVYSPIKAKSKGEGNESI